MSRREAGQGLSPPPFSPLSGEADFPELSDLLDSHLGFASEGLGGEVGEELGEFGGVADFDDGVHFVFWLGGC